MANRPLGEDREGTQYYTFLSLGGLHGVTASGEWKIYRTAASVDALIDALDLRGLRERCLKERLQLERDTIVASLRHLGKAMPVEEGDIARDLGDS